MTAKRYRGTVQSLNVIPFIDILFQLIIFFALACQFISTGVNGFPVAVPDGCKFAKSDNQSWVQVTTVTVIRITEEKTDFAVGAEKVTAANYADITEKLAELIDARLKDLPAEGRVVILRIDKDVPFDQAQYALAGVAASSATDIRLAVLKDKGTNLQ
jgi:biopolymer transport protein ExbD